MEAIVCQLTQTLIVCAFYRPTSRQLESVTNLCDFFRSIVDHYSDSPIWIAGDLNLPKINWDTSNISSSVYPSNLCDTVIDFVEEYGFTQTVNFATRGSNILDVFFTNRPSLVKSCHVVVQSLISSAPQAITPKNHLNLAQSGYPIY